MQKGGPARFYYCTNYLIDIDNNIIVDVEATPTNRVLEVESSQHMLERVEKKHAIKPQRLMADAAYGSGEMLDWMVQEKSIEPHIPVWVKTNTKPELFSIKDFTWDEANNLYICPEGIELHPGKSRKKDQKVTITVDKTIIYRARKAQCDACDKKVHCCPSREPRKIARSIYEDSREIARNITKSAAYRQSFKDRKKVEVLFGHLKRVLNLDRLRLRGLTGARDEFTLAATVQNLRKLAQQRYKPPNDRIYAPVFG